ncbi:MAG: helix-turn-helix domain-containing protein [Eubacterium sp.]
MNLSTTLKDLRLSANLTQKELAEKLKIGQSTIVGYEQGRNEPTISNLVAYAKYFEITVDEILKQEDITAEEYAAGARSTIKKSITPLEDDMLYAFREVGKKLGEKGQQALIDVAETMAGIK